MKTKVLVWLEDSITEERRPVLAYRILRKNYMAKVNRLAVSSLEDMFDADAGATHFFEVLADIESSPDSQEEEEMENFISKLSDELGYEYDEVYLQETDSQSPAEYIVESYRFFEARNYEIPMGF